MPFVSVLAETDRRLQLALRMEFPSPAWCSGHSDGFAAQPYRRHMNSFRTMTAAELSALLPSMLPRLWTFALRIAGDQHDAEDLVQRACVRALERAHQLQPGTAPLSWMFSIVQSIWFNEVRARSVRNRAGMEWDEGFLETIADPSAKTPEEQAMNSQIIRAVQQLPETQRVVMLLVAVEGLSYSEAAIALDVPIGTIMSRLSRARQAIGVLFSEPKKVGRAESAATSKEIGA
jgi:RNA polymerase sigma-70 factor, ECF subfamily